MTNNNAPERKKYEGNFLWEPPENIYVWQHGDDEPTNGMFIDAQDPSNPGVKYVRDDLDRAPSVEGMGDVLKTAITVRGMFFMEGLPPVTRDPIIVWKGGCNCEVIYYREDMRKWCYHSGTYRTPYKGFDEIYFWMRLPHPSFWPDVKIPSELMDEDTLYQLGEKWFSAPAVQQPIHIGIDLASGEDKTVLSFKDEGGLKILPEWLSRFVLDNIDREQPDQVEVEASKGITKKMTLTGARKLRWFAENIPLTSYGVIADSVFQAMISAAKEPEILSINNGEGEGE